MTTIETGAAHAELGAAPGTKDPRSVKRQGVLLAAAGFMIPFITALPFVGGGVTPVTWGEWLFALSTVLLMWSLMWCILLLGWDTRLHFDPHFLLVPAAACAVLLCVFVYLFPEVRLGVLQGWYVVLLFGAGSSSFREVLALNALMAGGYVGTMGILAAQGEPVSWPFEFGIVIPPFLLFTFFCATVLERLRREKSEMKALRNQLSHLARTDQLTDLPNRRHFDEYLQHHSALCSRSGATYAVGLIDIDHFKVINDSSGHGVGDRVLVEVANIIRSQLRQSDLGARLGGDEFAVLMVETNLADAGVVLTRILRSIASHDFSASGFRNRQVTVSIGVADYESEKTPSDVLRRADAELYAAKREGRNRLAVGASRGLPRAQASEELPP